MNTDVSFPDDPPDAATLEFLKCVFPNGLSQAEYLPLLYILEDDMTIRAASWFVGILLGKHYNAIYNDALGAKADVQELSIVDDLTKRLEACGYRKWLETA
ncbi:MAG TPA: hypothetical protein VHD90_25115 [Phototrophicaceae bacterium]|nr:hypothetical protein [Phototrophicaceae bacterium]